MTRYNKELGKTGEEAAVKYLIKNGYSILATNYRCRSGEIDIVAREGEFLVFIEVKTRTGTRYGSASEALDIRKKQRLRKLANYYLMMKGLTDVNCRFDVVTLQLADNTNWELELFRNAF